MAGDKINFLKLSTAPVPVGDAIDRSREAIDDFIDQLEASHDQVGLDALTDVVMARARSRGEHFVREAAQHDS